ncbi:transposase [uncultured Methanospirillum sp.]|uniref:IS66 family transposase n=1 Tax=uncultured Methanospirillum sp. TaxID=262503 RepID=UPI003748D47B
MYWLHVTSASQLTSYSTQTKRETQGINNIGILPNYTGISVHDFWNPYLSFSCKHSFCCAYILRELKRVEEETEQK